MCHSVDAVVRPIVEDVIGHVIWATDAVIVKAVPEMMSSIAKVRLANAGHASSVKGSDARSA
jgi:hypothetical protein